MISKIRLLLVCLFFGIATLSFAQDAKAIVNAHAEAIGGKKAMKAVKTIRQTASISLSAQGPTIPGIFYQKRPNKTRQEFEFQGKSIVQAFDGRQAWSINPLSGSSDPAVMPEAQAKGVMRRAYFDDILWENLEKRNIKLAYQGKEQIADIDCHYVLVTFEDGFQQHRYYNTKTHILHQLRQKQPNQTGQLVDTTVTFENWRQVNGIKYPYKITNSEGQTVIYEETIQNPPLEDTFFDMPSKASAP